MSLHRFALGLAVVVTMNIVVAVFLGESTNAVAALFCSLCLASGIRRISASSALTEAA